MVRALHLNETLPALGSGSSTLLPPSAASDKCSVFKYVTFSIRPVRFCRLCAANGPTEKGGDSEPQTTPRAQRLLGYKESRQRGKTALREESWESGFQGEHLNGLEELLAKVLLCLTGCKEAIRISTWLGRAPKQVNTSQVCSSRPHDGRKWNLHRFSFLSSAPLPTAFGKDRVGLCARAF